MSPSDDRVLPDNLPADAYLSFDDMGALSAASVEPTSTLIANLLCERATSDRLRVELAARSVVTESAVMEALGFVLPQGSDLGGGVKSPHCWVGTQFRMVIREGELADRVSGVTR